jgi:hypothetical protein
MTRVRVLTAALFACACLVGAASAQASEEVTVTAGFSPDKLGAPTNIFGSGTFKNTTGKVPSPIHKVTIIGPAGFVLDLTGVGICKPEALLATGPSACPKSSTAGAGKVLGAFELAGQVILENVALNLFRGPDQGSAHTLLIYVNGETPVSVQLVLKGLEIKAAKPYGLGVTFEVPPIATLPGALNASAEGGSLTLGASNASYIEKVHGKRKRVRVKGFIIPKRCPKGGFPAKSIWGFEDGLETTVKTIIPCPHH